MIHPEPEPLQENIESIYNSPHFSISTKCRFFYDSYKKLINFFIFIILLIVIISLFTNNSKNNYDNICLKYSQDDFANTVSLQCFKYIWHKTCKTEIPTNFNGGWWLRSPRGGTLIPCIKPDIGEKCGAGSFKTISTYLFKCNLYYDGL